jgi:sporulation related protein
MASRSLIATITLLVAASAAIGLLASAQAAATQKPQSNARYWVQSGAFKSSANARARCDLLKQRGYRFAVQRGPDIHGDKLFFCRSSQVLPYDKAASLAKRLRLKEPHDALLVLWHPKVISAPAPAAGKAEAAGDLENLTGRWCGDPAVYGNVPLQVWTVKKGGSVTLQIAGQRTPDGRPEQLTGNIEKLPGNLLKLSGDTAGFRSEAVYAMDGGGLRGVSFHQETKDNDTSMTTIPDSLHRCP